MSESRDNCLPLAYACSGCSNVAQLANQVALELDKNKQANMSCIAGVGGSVKPLVKLAKSGRPIIALDGCALHCVRHCLQLQSMEADLHYTLTGDGLEKAAFDYISPNKVREVCEQVLEDLKAITVIE